MFALTDPKILEAERFGGGKEPSKKIIGVCEHCGVDLDCGFEYVEDYLGNKFCDEDCFKDFYGFRIKEDFGDEDE